MISLDLTKSSEVRKAGDRSSNNKNRTDFEAFCHFISKSINLFFSEEYICYVKLAMVEIASLNFSSLLLRRSDFLSIPTKFSYSKNVANIIEAFY